MGDKPQISVLITDLDDTLWNWFETWYASFTALLSELVRISGVDAIVLEREIREVHQLRGTSEYSYLIQELPSLRENQTADETAKTYQEAIAAFRRARAATLRLYPGVLDTLTAVHARGTRIVGYTESLAYYTSYRIRTLGLDGLLDFVYSPPDHDLPQNVDVSDLRTMPSDHYQLTHTQHRHTPWGVLKPAPAILDAIVDELAPNRQSVAYVGDSLMKDVAMAQAVGVLDVHARYGEERDASGYELLRRVTHWTPEDVERERLIMESPNVHPRFTLKDGFFELESLFDFVQP